MAEDAGAAAARVVTSAEDAAADAEAAALRACQAFGLRPLAGASAQAALAERPLHCLVLEEVAY